MGTNSHLEWKPVNRAVVKFHEGNVHTKTIVWKDLFYNN